MRSAPACAWLGSPFFTATSVSEPPSSFEAPSLSPPTSETRVILGPPRSNTLFTFLSQEIQLEPLTSGRLLLCVSGVAAWEIWQKSEHFMKVGFLQRFPEDVGARRGVLSRGWVKVALSLKDEKFTRKSN
jgi:hypothetical protein